MDPSKLTQKSQEALQAAQALAIEMSHQEVDVEHLLLSLLQQDQGLVPRLLRRMEIADDAVAGAVRADLDRRPQVGGGGIEPGKIYLTGRLSKLLVQAEKEAKRLRDEYVSVEHLLMVMLAEGRSTDAGKTPDNAYECPGCGEIVTAYVRPHACMFCDGMFHLCGYPLQPCRSSRCNHVLPDDSSDDDDDEA